MSPEELRVQERIELVRKNWQMHHDIKIDAIKSLDNIIFAVSTGALAISISFIGSLKVSVSWLEIYLLLASWISLIIAIGASGLSHWYNAQTALLNQFVLNKHLITGFSWPVESWNMDTRNLGTGDDEQKTAQKITNLNEKFSAYRKYAFITLLIGIVTLFLFGVVVLVNETSPAYQNFHHRSYY